MPRGDKSKYTPKQKRQVRHIEEGYEKRGLPEKEAERRAWATENKISGGGRLGGSGEGHPENKAPYKKGGKLGGRAAAARPAGARSASAKKAARTRARPGH
jgi:plasmid stabilization system protein ParE